MTKTNLLKQMTREPPSEGTIISQHSPLYHLVLNLFADLKNISYSTNQSRLSEQKLYAEWFCSIPLTTDRIEPQQTMSLKQRDHMATQYSILFLSHKLRWNNLKNCELNTYREGTWHITLHPFRLPQPQMAYIPCYTRASITTSVCEITTWFIVES